MDFLDALETLRRRWVILLAGIALVAGVGAGAFFVAPTSYQASGQLVLLLPSQSAGAEGPINPYVTLNSSLTVAASLLGSSITTDQAKQSISQAGFTADYAVGIDPSSGPILSVTAESDNPTMAVATRDEVVRRLEDELVRVQTAEGVATRQLIHGRVFAAPSAAEPLTGSKVRVLAGIVGVGGIATLLTAFVVDGLARRRRTPGIAAATDEEADIEATQVAVEDEWEAVRAADVPVARSEVIRLRPHRSSGRPKRTPQPGSADWPAREQSREDAKSGSSHGWWDDAENG